MRRSQWAASSGPRCSRVPSECPDGIGPLAALVRSKGDPTQNVILLGALTSRLPCGFRHSRTRPPPLWSPELWECPACPAPGPEDEKHVLTCSATGVIWDDVLDSVCSMLGVSGRQRLPARLQPTRLAALFDWLRVVRVEAISDWRGGCWSALSLPDTSLTPDLLATIAKATASLRPTRVVLALPPARYSLPFDLSLSDGCTTVLVFQNSAADALAPLTATVPSLRRDWEVRWGQGPGPCPAPPPEAFTLRRRPPSLSYSETQAWLRNCLLEDGAPPTLSPPSLVAEALRDLSGVSAYTKRLGVLPDSFIHILSHAARDTVSPPSLHSLSSMLSGIRLKLWEASLLCVRAAHSARCWMLRSVVGDLVAAEEALFAQRRYERRRAGPPSKRRRVSPPCLAPVRVSTRARTRPKLPGFSVAWMGEYVEAPEECSRLPQDSPSWASLSALCHLI